MRKVKREDILDLITKSEQAYSGPADDMWHGSIIPSHDYYAIEDYGFIVCDDETVFDFFCLFDSVSTFKKVVKSLGLKKAIVPTYNVPYHDAIQHYFDLSTIDSIQFYENESIPHHTTLDYELVKSEELEDILSFSKTCLDESDDWVRGYYTNLIAKEGLYKFSQNDIVGLGEIRIHQGYANLGMNVSKYARRKGYATEIVLTLKSICNSNGYKTIASTTMDNIGSIKTLKRCGYIEKHKIFEVYLDFDEE